MRLNNKGFSFVELLAAVTILAILSGIAIVGVTNILHKAHLEYYKNQEKNVVLAAQSYMNSNKSELPKIVGKKNEVKVSTLRASNFLKKDLTAYDGRTPCDPDKSKVIVFKYDQNEYSYTAHLSCDGSEILDETHGDGPGFAVGWPTDNNDVAISYVELTVKGDSIDESINILSYSYIISVFNEETKKFEDIINSGNIPYRKPTLTKKVSLSKFTISGNAKMRVKMTATNVKGETKSKVFVRNFNDKVAPTCIIDPKDKPNTITGIKSWTRGPITVTVGCDDQDGKGSGCEKNSYTKTFTTDGKTHKIKVKDNAGNANEDGKCTVTTYIDRTTPDITLNIRSSEGGSVKKKYTVKGQTAKPDLVEEDTYTTWLNKANYPNGVYLDVTVHDETSKIKTFAWTESDSYNDINSITNAKNKVTSKGDSNKAEYTAKNHITKDGYILQRIRVEDYTGNTVDYKLILKVDKTNPACDLDDYSNECKNSGVSVKVYCEDLTSGVDKCGGDAKKGAHSTNTQKSGLKSTTKYTVTDVAGNSVSCSATINRDMQWRKASCSACSGCSSAGCNLYESCTNAAVCGTYCCGWSYEHCHSGQCGKYTTTNYNVIKDDAFNVTCIKQCPGSCRNSSCNCERYNTSCPKCGCSSWGNWSDWSYNELNCNGTTANTCKTDTQYVYRHQSQSCKNGITNTGKIKCAAGKYLPKGRTSCETCLSKYYCPGGEWNKNDSSDQGLNACPNGYKNSNAGSSKISDCYMNVIRNNYVAKEKDANYTKCAYGYVKPAHKVNYGSKSACELYNAKKYGGVYVVNTRNGTDWFGSCTGKHKYIGKASNVGTWMVIVGEYAVNFCGFCHVDVPKYNYCFELYGLDESGFKDETAILVPNTCHEQKGLANFVFKRDYPEYRESIDINWSTQQAVRPEQHHCPHDCYDHGNGNG